MLKRPLSPGPLPAAKRIHVSQARSRASLPEPTFDTLLYDELILHIFSYLPYTDLCSIQATNRNWARLALDNQLWKSLYLGEFGRARLRGGRGFAGRTDGREVRKLPGRHVKAASSEDLKDWKWMFRISSNWRTGRCHVSQLRAQDEPDDDPQLNGQERELSGRTHMILSGTHTIFASSQPSHSPTITLLTPSGQVQTIHSPPARPQPHPVQITALAVDQSPPDALSSVTRLAVCFSNGEFAVHTLSARTHSYTPALRTARTAPIEQAAYHHPLLLTLSQSFALSVYELTDNGGVHLAHILTSFTSFPPASLVLTTPEPQLYKAVLTYASPVYPKHWSIGVTEVLLSAAPPEPAGAASIRLLSTRSTRAFDVPPGFVDAAKLRGVREQWGRKVGGVAAAQTDGRWVVLAPAAASTLFSSAAPSSTFANLAPTSVPLQLYRLSFPPLPAPPKLVFVRSLHGQTGAVAALALADGRCVSLGVDGRIWVWDLEGGAGAEVAQGEMGADAFAKGSVVFDDRRIVSAGARGVVVRNFDV
ncbi:hypothetical protein BV25DRAFT_1883533 [Artomyces pyxidatus]|uniref:Uncharacterized protein n=1 Tax=Artomyces pyxidatus TaxID=48021 RepID=A0ACB8T4I2_9AGAM|nr:hypothetical protein BV25DRAFT_1883533 [Artomyces pyxidatus]